MTDESQSCHRVRRPRLQRQPRTHKDLPGQRGAQYSHHEAGSSTTNPSGMSSPVDFVEIGDMEWPFSKVCLDD